MINFVLICTKTVKFPKNLRSKWRGDCALAVRISNDVNISLLTININYD